MWGWPGVSRGEKWWWRCRLGCSVGWHLSRCRTRVLAAAGWMRMGQVCRVTMVFRKRALAGGDELSADAGVDAGSLVDGASGREPDVDGMGWWDRARRGCWGCRRRSCRLRWWGRWRAPLAVSEESVRAAMEGFYTHDWTAEGGAYSWVAMGGAGASAEMALPVDAWLYFAGEHTDVTGHWGTVHGALRSGLRAGRQVVEGFVGPG